MALMPDLDRNEEHIVVTQAIGHWLYVPSFKTDLVFNSSRSPAADTTAWSTKASPPPCQCCLTRWARMPS